MKRWTSLVSGASVVAALLLAPLAGTAQAGSGCTIVGVGADAEVVCSDSGGDGGGPGPDQPIYQVPTEWTEYYYTPACDPNGPPPNYVDALCMRAVSTCPDDGDIRYYVYTRLMSPQNEPIGTWEHVGTQCRGLDDPPEGGPPVITTWMVIDAARAAVPSTSVTSDPVALSYVNVPTNFSTADGAVTVDVEVLGVSIPVVFTPTGVTWAFGDGGSGSGAGIPGATVGQAGAVEHSYVRRGTYNVSATRTFDVVALLPGGQTLALPEPLSSTSAPYALQIDEIQSIVTEVG